MHPVLVLPLNEGSGDIVYDRSGYNNHGTIYGGATWQKEWRDWLLSFDGVDDCVDCGDVGLNGLAQVSMSAWIKTSETTKNRTIVMAGKNLAGKFGFGMQVWEGYLRVIMSDPNDDFAYNRELSSTFIADGSWHFVTIVLKDGYVYYYIDGVEDPNSPMTGFANTHNSISRLMLGNAPWTAYYFIGIIGEVLVFRKALSGEQIAFLSSLFRGEKRSPPVF